MNKKNVLVLFGGRSPEHEISKSSAATVILNTPEEKYNVIPVYITKEGKWLLYDGYIDNIKNIQWEKFGTPAILSPDAVNRGLIRIVSGRVKTIPVDVVFPVLHGRLGEDGTVQGLFELAGIPYVGCGVLASAAAMNKAFTKTIVKSISVPQAEYLIFSAYDLDDIDRVTKKIRYSLGYPVFIKPSSGGSSIGISKAANKKEVEAALVQAALYDDTIVVERAINGRELECAVLGGGDDTAASVVGEIITGAQFYDFDAKYNSRESKTIVPADIPEEISEQIRAYAVKIFNAIDGRGLSRVDFFLENETNNVIFNEINTMPGFTSISMYPMMWEQSGLALPDLIDKLIQLGLVNA